VLCAVLWYFQFEIEQFVWSVLIFVGLNASGNIAIYLSSAGNLNGFKNIANRSTTIVALTLLEMFLWDLICRQFFPVFPVSEYALLLFGIFSLMSGAFVGVVSWLLQQEKSRLEINARIIEIERLQKVNELASLQYQLQPHFLFNSLNSIYALAGQSPDQARSMIHLLASFFRRSLQYQENEKVKLSDELEAIKAYFEIEKIRFQDRLVFQIKATAEELNYKVPAMILQPLVENAIKHGLYGIEGQVFIEIAAIKEGTSVAITVTNPFDATGNQQQNSLGVGLQNVKKRMLLLYGRSDLLETKKSDNGLFIAKLKIPI
jgi:LytS/YehU family sensor histidine kinase